jgi:hypothetical protein
MSIILTPLEEQIVTILRTAPPEGFSLPQLVQHLKDAGNGSPTTSQVRNAVWQLIHKRRADFTPRRLVRILES